MWDCGTIGNLRKEAAGDKTLTAWRLVRQ